MQLTLGKSFDYLIPYDVPMIRLGSQGDCGHVVPIQALDAQYLVSMGLGTNWSFDEQWLKMVPNGHIHAYDGTIDPSTFAGSLRLAYDAFFQKSVVHFIENVYEHNIDVVLNRVAGPAFFKIDIEGSEYEIISKVAQEQNIIGMIVEFHALDIDYMRQKFEHELYSMDQFRIVHVHANNFGGISSDGLPHTLEISFLRGNLCEHANKRYHAYLPGLDSPNDLNKEDYMLYFDQGV
jgi:hypothetical protein